MQLFLVDLRLRHVSETYISIIRSIIFNMYARKTTQIAMSIFQV
jgi:hypothetical protein